MTTPQPQQFEPGELATLARDHGMAQVGQRPGFFAYLRELWDRRSFLWTMSTAKSYSQNQNNYLGQLWTILSPLTLAVVYYVVFGIMLRTSEGIDNFTGYLVTGIFIFLSISAALSAGANSILSNMNVVRSLQFPRAVLPLSVSVSEMINLVPAIAAMFVIVLLTGESLSWTWLLMPVLLVVIMIFTGGACMIAARLVVAARDLRNFIPMVVRMLRYGSGVFFSVEVVRRTVDSEIFGLVLEWQPVALYLNLARSCLMAEVEMNATMWLVGAAWAVVFFVVGLVVFWSGEDKYGRV